MNQSLNQVVEVRFDGAMVILRLADGRIIGNPLDWHPWLANATAEQRAHVECYELSVYWPELDDGLDVDEMMKGIPPRLINPQAETV